MKNRVSVQLTERDFSIFQLILAQGAKTPADLAGQFWGNKSKKAKAGFQRIRKLILAGLLRRGNPKLLYLSDEAKAFLAKHPGVKGPRSARPPAHGMEPRAGTAATPRLEAVAPAAVEEGKKDG